MSGLREWNLRNAETIGTQSKQKVLHHGLLTVPPAVPPFDRIFLRPVISLTSLQCRLSRWEATPAGFKSETTSVSRELPKAYDPSAIEKRWAEYWLHEKLFVVPTPAPGTKQPVFTMLLPPPNVTGRLHMGHMLEHTEMDIVARWRRMRGDLTLWLPGTDHAGIATQMLVERQLASEGKSRQEMGREAFLKRVWEWREHYGSAILEQMKRLGTS